MNGAIYEQLTEALKQQPLPLARVHAIVCDAGSRWSEEQLHLFLICMDGVEVDAGVEPTVVRLGQRTERDELIDAIRQVVRSRAGRPVPAAEVRRLLPSKFVTTEDQIKRLAKETPGLEVFGPGLMRIVD
uniref:Uncharacterized protein n=1 Tax=Cyanothece sp. (strain PCC 7425 / ATCC 29141) TaxID=395961 RepID=B8HZR4_CYAP4